MTMQLVVIGDIIAVDSFRLVGVEGIVVEASEEALDAVRRRMREGAAVLIGQSLAAPILDELDRLRNEYRDSVCLEIPDLGGEPYTEGTTERRIEQAIGMKL